LLEKVGVAYSDEIGGFAIANEAAVKAFNNKFSSSVYSRQQGLSESEIARLHVERMLLDMRNTFHGGPNSFNQKLLDAIKEKHREIIDFRIQAGAKKRKGLVDGDEFGGAWENAAASLTFKDFEDMTVGMHPMGEINTDLVTMGEVKDMKIFEDNSGLDHIFSKFQNWSMEVMDAQVTGMYRQKALWIAYDANMGRLKPYEKMLYERYKQANISSGQNIGQAERHAKALAEKRVTEIAWRQSTEEILEYVDNPNIRSNMAIAIRSVGRFYRATEDFYRRLYRVFGKTPLRSLYRLRLLNTGLDANGDIYEDDKGDKYIIFPTDTIINSAVEPVVRAFTGNEDFNIPTFNELSLKLRLINPSFAPDAGYPALSGPAGAYSTLVLKSLVGQVVPFLERLGLSEEKADALEAKMKKAQDVIAKIGLGNFADTTNFANAAIPMFASTLGQALATLTIDEQAIRDNELNRQQTSAVMQAMRYFQAFGLGIGNVYDLAVATYVGKNPGKLIYTVPTTEKEWKVVIAMTDEVKNWVNRNGTFVDTYKEMSYVYAPKTGEFNGDVYNFLEAEGLINLPTFEDYLVKLQVAVDKERYFEVQKQLEERLATTGITQERKELINIAAKTKKDMTTANPYLQAEVNGSINEQGALRVKFKALFEANQDKRNPADAKTKEAMQIALEEVANFVANATDDYNSRRYDFSSLKEQQREEVQAIINQLAKAYPAVNEANRVVFKPLLNSFSRDAVQAGAGR